MNDRHWRLMKQSAATLLGAALIALSPGLDFYRVWGAMIAQPGTPTVLPGAMVVPAVPIVPGSNLKHELLPGWTQPSTALMGKRFSTQAPARFEGRESLMETSPSMSPHASLGSRKAQSLDSHAARLPSKAKSPVHSVSLPSREEALQSMVEPAAELSRELAGLDSKPNEYGAAALARFFDSKPVQSGIAPVQGQESFGGLFNSVANAQYDRNQGAQPATLGKALNRFGTSNTQQTSAASNGIAKIPAIAPSPAVPGQKTVSKVLATLAVQALTVLKIAAGALLSSLSPAIVYIPASLAMTAVGIVMWNAGKPEGEMDGRVDPIATVPLLGLGLGGLTYGVVMGVAMLAGSVHAPMTGVAITLGAAISLMVMRWIEKPVSQTDGKGTPPTANGIAGKPARSGISLKALAAYGAGLAVTAAIGVTLGLNLPISASVSVLLGGSVLLGLVASYVLALTAINKARQKAGKNTLGESPKLALLRGFVLHTGVAILSTGLFGFATAVLLKVLWGVGTLPTFIPAASFSVASIGASALALFGRRPASSGVSPDIAAVAAQSLQEARKALAGKDSDGKPDAVKTFRHVIHALTVRIQYQMASGKTVPQMSEDILKEIADMKEFFDIPSDNAETARIVADLKTFFDKASVRIVSMSKAFAYPDIFRSETSVLLNALQRTADTAGSREELLASMDYLLDAQGRIRRSDPLANGITSSGERLTGVEVIGKVIAFALSFGPAAWAYAALLLSSPVLGWAVMAQSLPLALFTLFPKTGSRTLLIAPGILGAGLAAALLFTGSPVLGALALVNAAGMIHYGILSTRESEDSPYNDEERGLVAFFSALFNTAGLTTFAALSGWTSWLGLAGPLVAFIILAYNKAFNFNIKFFKSWGAGFIEGFDASMSFALKEGRWWWPYAKPGIEIEKWTGYLGFIPAGLLWFATESAAFAVGLANSLPYALLTAFEKAVGDTWYNSWGHQYLRAYRAVTAALMETALKRMPGGRSSNSEFAFRGVRWLWGRANLLTAPLGLSLLLVGHAFQLVEWVFGMGLALTVGPVIALLGSLLRGFGADMDDSPAEKQRPAPNRRTDSAISVFGGYMALAMTFIPSILAFRLNSDGWLAVLPMGMLMSAMAMVDLAGLFKPRAKQGKKDGIFETAVAAAAMATGFFITGQWHLGIIASANVIGLLRLEFRSGNSEEDIQPIRAAAFFSALALGISPVLAGLSLWAGMPVAAASTGLLALVGAFKFDYAFFKGFTRGLADGLGESVMAGVTRSTWWLKHLMFWKGGSWVAVLGALPVFLFFAAEAVAGFCLGIASAFLWSPLRGLEKGFGEAWKNGVGHRLLASYNTFLSRSIRTGDLFSSDRVFGWVAGLFGRPNLVTIPLGLALLAAGQVLQLAGTALGAAFGLVAGIPVALVHAAKGTLPAEYDVIEAGKWLGDKLSGDPNVSRVFGLQGVFESHIYVELEDITEKSSDIPTRFEGYRVLVIKEGTPWGWNGPILEEQIPSNGIARGERRPPSLTEDISKIPGVRYAELGGFRVFRVAIDGSRPLAEVESAVLPRFQAFKGVFDRIVFVHARDPFVILAIVKLS